MFCKESSFAVIRYVFIFLSQSQRQRNNYKLSKDEGKRQALLETSYDYIFINIYKVLKQSNSQRWFPDEFYQGTYSKDCCKISDNDMPFCS